MNTRRKTEISFSILMANYNNNEYIEESIESVLSQTYPNWELIIVDDYSTDNSVNKIKLYLKDKRIKMIQHNKNIGYGGALKTAADNVSCDILGILDADDRLHEKALEVMAKAYNENPECGFIYSTMWNCDSNLENCVENTMIGPTIPEKTNIFHIKVSHFKTFRKDAYNKTSGFDPMQKKAVDKDIIFKLEEVVKFKFIDIPLYYYRQHERGISQDKNKFQARVYHYIARCKAYQRRLNKNIPNCTKKELYKEYFTITLFKLRKTIKNLLKFFNGPILLRIILKLLPHSQIHKKIENLLKKLK